MILSIELKGKKIFTHHQETIYLKVTIYRPSLQYKILPNNYEFPTKKPKRQSFEWYNPKHILKKNWMLKYQHVVPSLVN
jgi:hypothetical protein